MTGLDSTAVKVGAALLAGAASAYDAVGAPRTCSCCGASTDDRDGYPVDTPFGPTVVCPACNVSPQFWNQAEDVFVGPRDPKGN